MTGDYRMICPSDEKTSEREILRGSHQVQILSGSFTEVVITNPDYVEALECFRKSPWHALHWKTLLTLILLMV